MSHTWTESVQMNHIGSQQEAPLLDPKQKVVQTHVRLPADVHRAIARIALEEHRSLRGEIAHRLRKSLDADREQSAA